MESEPLSSSCNKLDDVQDTDKGVLEEDINDVAALLHEIQISQARSQMISDHEPNSESVAFVKPTTTIKTSLRSKEINALQRLLRDAVECGHVEVLERIYDAFPDFDFDFKFSTNYNLLSYACKYDQKDVVEWFLNHLPATDVDWNGITDDKETALILAVNNCTPSNVKEVVQCLLKNGGQNLGNKEKHKMTALHIACSKGYTEIVTLLLDYNKAWAAQRKVEPKILTNAVLKNETGNTPLLLAIFEDHRDIVKIWLEIGNDPSSLITCSCKDKNKKGFNAVLLAVRYGRLECLKMMESYGVMTDELITVTNKLGWNIIHCAVASGSLETLKWLLDVKSDILMNSDMLDAPNKKLYTPFLLACEYLHGKNEMAKYLIKLSTEENGIRINFNAKTEDGKTALHFVAMHDAGELLDFLLDEQVDVMLQEKKGATVLHVATSRSSMVVESRLKEKLSQDEYQALAETKNTDGKTAEDVRVPVHVPLEIKKRGDKSVEAYLKALREGKSKNNHCNLVVLGEERVGKTSLIKGILGKEFDPNCKSTQGVQLEQIETLAECVDIEMQTESETWKPVPDPMKRIREEHSDIVARAVTEADPKHVKPIRKKINKDVLLEEVERIIAQVKLQQQNERHKKQNPPSLVYRPRGESSFKKDFQSFPQSAEPYSTHSLKSSKPLSPMTTVDTPTAPPSFERQISNPKPLKTPAPKDSADGKHNSSSKVHSVPVVKPSTQLTVSMSRSESKSITEKLKKRPKDKKENLIFHAIDFAGQALYRPMHHCFITHRAVYLVVFKLTDLLSHIKGKGESCGKGPIHEIRYWLNNIMAHSTVANEPSLHPKIFLVGTHRNGDPFKQGIALKPLTDDDVKTVNNELTSVFVSDMDEKRYHDAIQFMSKKGESIVFSVENSHTGKHDEKRRESGILKFMKRIEEIKTKIPFLNDDFPTSYMRFELKLLEMREERKEYPLSTTRKEVEGWARGCGIDEEGISTAIQFYHDIRFIVDQGLVLSPFKQKPTPDKLDCDLILLSPQWLGDMMCKIVELHLGNEDFKMERMKSFFNSGVMLRGDLQKCLLGCAALETNDVRSFNNLLEILESYCLIFRLSKPLYKLLHLEAAPDSEEDKFLIPCKLPSLKLKLPCLNFSKDCYKFEFDFQSYLPNEVYIHCVCDFLFKIAQADVPVCDDKRKVELRDSFSKFYHFMLGNSLADWKIEMDNSRHVLIFSVFPRDDVYSSNPCQYIIEVSELVLDDVCSSGSLGRLAYKGGPRVKCSCIDNEDLTLPFVQYIPGINVSSPGDAFCKCPECSHKRFDVNEILKQQVSPAEQKPANGPVVQNIQNTVLIGTAGEISQSKTHEVAGQQQNASSVSPSPMVIASKAEQKEYPEHHLLVKIADVLYEEGEMLALYLDKDMEWDSTSPKIQKVKKLVEILKQCNKTLDELRIIVQCIDEDKARVLFQ